MAWTGVPVVTLLGVNIVRITGLSLAGGAVGTIGLNGGAGDVSLPAKFQPVAVPAPLTLVDLIRVSYVNGPPAGGAESRHIHIEKNASPFLATITNDAVTATAELEIWVEYLHSLIR